MTVSCPQISPAAARSIKPAAAEQQDDDDDDQDGCHGWFLGV
jgi:hypothetical protein